MITIIPKIEIYFYLICSVTADNLVVIEDFHGWHKQFYTNDGTTTATTTSFQTGTRPSAPALSQSLSLTISQPTSKPNSSLCWYL